MSASAQHSTAGRMNWRGTLAVTAFLVLWELLVRVKFPGMATVPGPIESVNMFWEKYAGNTAYWQSWIASFRRVLLGFLAAQILGIPLGLALGTRERFRELVFPVIELLRPIPPLAWVPLSILFWPTSEIAIVFITFIGAFFIIAINVFDGVRGIIKLGKAQVSLFAVKPVAPGPGSFDDSTSSTKALWGVYTTIPRLDFYYLGYRNRDARFGGREGREVRHTLGARYYGASRGWHWKIEAAGQFGSFAGEEIGAWTLATEVGRKLSGLPLSPDATVRFNIVSGDGNRNDDHLGTFNALFPKGKYFGELSPVGPTNIVSLNPRVSAPFRKGFSGSLAGMA